MGWSQELNDFSEGFSSGMKMVDSRSDRENKKLEAEERRQRIRRGEIELDPDFLRLEREGKESTIEQQRATAESTRQDAITKARKNTPEYRALEDAQMAAETAAQNATTRYNTALAVAKEYENTPKAREAAEAAAAAKLELDEATAEGYRLDSARKAWLLEPEQKKIETDAAKEKIAGDAATRKKTEADTESQTIKNKMDAFIQSTVTGTQGAQTLKESMEGKQAVDDAAAGATDAPFVQGEEPPGPQSRAVEVPEVSTATHDEPLSMADEPSFERQRALERSPRMFGGPVTEDAADYALPLPPGGRPEFVAPARPIEEEPEAVSTEAAPAEPAPVTSEGKPGPRARDRNVPLPKAGPRAHPHVDEQQDRASVRKLPIASATMNVLEYAGTQTGIRAVVFSGGQAHKGEKGPRTGSTRHDGGFAADVRLYDMETNRMLDMRNPEDAERMRDFGMYAVQAGATGIGAGEGYMGNSEMHIGFGPEATWGGAPWIGDALAQGKGIRDQMPDTGQLPDMYESGSVYKEGRKAALAGFEYLANSYGLDQDTAVDSPEMEQAAADLMSGKDAAEPEQVEEAERIAQETAKEAGFIINPDEVPIYTLSMVYNAYIGTGQLEEAQKVAGAVTMHYLKLASQFSAVAKVAAGQGDTAGVAEALARVYANVPDGSKAEFNELSDGRYEVVITNQETGEVTNRNIMTPEEMGGAAMKINPSDFLTVVTAAEGKDMPKTLSRESAVDMGHPEWAGRSMDEVTVMQSQARIDKGGAVEVGEDGAVSVSAGAGKPVKGLKPAEQDAIVEGVTEGFTRYAANVAASNEGEGPEGELYTTQLDPNSNSDLMMQIRPIAEEIALNNYQTLRPDLAVSAVVRMVGQEPAAVKPAAGGGFEVKLKGMNPFTISEDMYQRLTDARVKYGPQSDGTEPAFRQGRDTRRAMGQLPMLPDYDPTRSRIVPSLRTVRRPSEAGLEPGPEAVPTRPIPARPIVQSHPAVGGPVEIPSWVPLHESVRP